MFTIVSSFYLCCLASYFQKFFYCYNYVKHCTVVIFLKATKGKSQNRMSPKQQQFLKNDKCESFLDFYLVYECLFEDYAMKIVEVTIGHF